MLKRINNLILNLLLLSQSKIASVRPMETRPAPAADPAPSPTPPSRFDVASNVPDPTSMPGTVPGVIKLMMHDISEAKRIRWKGYEAKLTPDDAALFLMLEKYTSKLWSFPINHGNGDVPGGLTALSEEGRRTTIREMMAEQFAQRAMDEANAATK